MVSFDAVSLILAGIRTLARGPLRFFFFFGAQCILVRGVITTNTFCGLPHIPTT